MGQILLEDVGLGYVVMMVGIRMVVMPIMFMKIVGHFGMVII